VQLGTQAKFRKVGPMRLPSRIGKGTFELYYYEFAPGRRFIVLQKGAVRGRPDVLVRVESNCVWAHVFGSARCDCAEQTHEAMRRIIDEGEGLLVHAYDEDGRGISLEDHVKVYMLQDQGFDSVDADLQAGFQHYDRRNYEHVIEILRDFSLSQIRLLSNNPDKLDALSEHFWVTRVPLEAVRLDIWNAAQIYAKKVKMNHLFSFDAEDAVIRRLAEFSVKEGSRSEYREDDE
jgi:GTP cyclohydrolase II